MPCEWRNLPGGGMVHIRYAKGAVKKCRWCQSLSTKLCDFVVSDPAVITHRKTCDAPMCNDHAKSVGPNLDYCPDHAGEKAP